MSRIRTAVVMTARITLTVLPGLTLAIYGFVAASHERDAMAREHHRAVTPLDAEREVLAESEAVTQFHKEAFATVDPDRSGRDSRLLDLLSQASQSADARLAEHPLIEADVRRILGLNDCTTITTLLTRSALFWRIGYPPADEQDRVQVGGMARDAQQPSDRSVELAHMDQGYTGEQPTDAAEKHVIELQAAKLPEARRGRVLLPNNRMVERK